MQGEAVQAVWQARGRAAHRRLVPGGAARQRYQPVTRRRLWRSALAVMLRDTESPEAGTERFE